MCCGMIRAQYDGATTTRKDTPMQTTNFKAGDAVTWARYGVAHRGTLVETPRGNVAIIRDHANYNRTWASVDSLTLVA